MNLTDILFIAKSHGIKPDASLSDILLAKKLDEGIIRTVKGNPLRFSARKAQKAKNPSLTLLPIQDLHGYDRPWIGGMGKNIIPYTLATIKTINGTATWNKNVATLNGFAFTVLTDNGNNVIGIKVNGSAQETETSFYVYNDSTFSLSNTGYILNGCPSGGSNTSCLLQTKYTYRGGSETIKNEYGSGATFTPASACTLNHVKIVIRANTAVNNLIYYPMIRLSTETDATFAPYENICPISGRTMSSVWGSKKNMLPTSLSTIKSLNTIGEWNGNAYTINNVTFTVQTEGDKVVGINANGQASADATLFIYGNTTAYFSATTITFKGSGKIRIGTPTNGSSTTFLGVVWSTIQNKFIYGTEQFDSGYTMNGFGVRIKNGYNAQNVLFKPIIYMADEDYTFEPYEQSCFINFTFGQTVYGGKVDFDTGVMSIDTLRV